MLTDGDGVEGIVRRIGDAITTARTGLGISLSELARRTGLAKSTLSQLEAGKGNPGIETLWALALTLKLPISHFLTVTQPPVRLIGATAGQSVQAADADYAATLLAPGSGGRRDLYRLLVQPDRPHRSAAHAPGTIEHLVLATGLALAGPLEAPRRLQPGDCLTYPGDAPHVFQALAPDTIAILAIDHPGPN